jgi:hypothetical protein
MGSDLAFVSGEEVLPIGGFTGAYPSPTVDELRALVASGQLHLVIGTSTSDSRMAWIAAHCRELRRNAQGIVDYYCVPANAG